MTIEIGDIVVRKSYHCDIHFRVEDIRDDVALLRGITERLIADSPLEDLLVILSTAAKQD